MTRYSFNSHLPAPGSLIDAAVLREMGYEPVLFKTGYRVLDNGDIVGLDDDGNPTSEPFAGYVSEEHRRISEERKRREERGMSLITDPIEIARIDAEHEAHWARENERMEWQKEFAEGHMRIARLMLKVTGSSDFNLGRYYTSRTKLGLR